MTVLTPPASLSEATFGRPLTPFVRDFGSPDAPKSIENVSKTISKGSETDPK